MAAVGDGRGVCDCYRAGVADAAEGHLDLMVPAAEPLDEVATVRITAGTRRRLLEHAAARGWDVSTFLRTLIVGAVAGEPALSGSGPLISMSVRPVAAVGDVTDHPTAR